MYRVWCRSRAAPVIRETAMEERERHPGKAQRRKRKGGTDRSGISRRSFLQAGTLAGAGAALTAWSTSGAQDVDQAQLDSERRNDHSDSEREIAGASIAELQALMVSGRLTSRQLVNVYQRRIHAIDKG